MLHTKQEIEEQVQILEQVMNRADPATANMAEWRRDELVEILASMKDYQLADCEHLFWC